MRPARHAEIPLSRRPALRRGLLLEWVSLGYLITVVALMYLVMGSSQAMRAAWLEDVLSMVPPAAFLVSAYFRKWPPNEEYPYGYHRAVSVAFLVASVAILGVGGYLAIESASKLIQAEHPTIGTIELLGYQIWLGWLMLPAIAYTGIPSVFLGRAKLRPARELHDKTLYADAVMNKADWMTAAAAMAGVLGIAVGWWWADSVAALAISADVIHDGLKYVRLAVGDLMDRAPRTVDGRQRDPLPARLATELRGLSWVADAEVRFREDGHVFVGEAFLVPNSPGDPVPRVREVLKVGQGLDWRIQDLTVQIGDPTQPDSEDAGAPDPKPEAPKSARHSP